MGIGIPMNQANTPFMTFSFSKLIVSWMENAQRAGLFPEIPNANRKGAQPV